MKLENQAISAVKRITVPIPVYLEWSPGHIRSKPRSAPAHHQENSLNHPAQFSYI